jgi:hypothetical protein
MVPPEQFSTTVDQIDFLNQQQFEELIEEISILF